MPRAPDFLRHRFRNQRLTGPGFSTPAQVVTWLGAVQSQDYLGAKWSVGQRIVKGTDAIVEDAFNRGAILRTHLLRPTWHFVTPADIRWMLALTAPHIQRLNAYWYRVNRVDQPLVARARKLVEKALVGGNCHTRAEVGALLARGGIQAATTRLAAILMHLELDGLIASGPMRGKQHTYALLDERAPATPAIARDEALARLAHRFFSSHGPATVRHFAWWSDLSLRECAAGLAAARNRLTSETIDGVEWFGLVDPVPRSPVRGALFIPEYDEALVGMRALGLTDLPRSRKKWTDTFLRPVFIDGCRAGTWRRHLGPGVRLETNLFSRLDSAQAAKLARAAARYGKFLGQPVVLV